MTMLPHESVYRLYIKHTAGCRTCGRPGRCLRGRWLWSIYRKRLAA